MPVCLLSLLCLQTVCPAAGEHPLQYNYTFWYSRRTPSRPASSQSYEQNIRQIGSVASVTHTHFYLIISWFVPTGHPTVSSSQMQCHMWKMTAQTTRTVLLPTLGKSCETKLRIGIHFPQTVWICSIWSSLIPRARRRMWLLLSWLVFQTHLSVPNFTNCHDMSSREACMFTQSIHWWKPFYIQILTKD